MYDDYFSIEHWRWRLKGGIIVLRWMCHTNIARFVFVVLWTFSFVCGRHKFKFKVWDTSFAELFSSFFSDCHWTSSCFATKIHINTDDGFVDFDTNVTQWKIFVFYKTFQNLVVWLCYSLIIPSFRCICVWWIDLQNDVHAQFSVLAYPTF